LPYAFTEQGVAMLSGILNSEKAIEVNIAIMRAFVFMRQYALTHKDLTEKLQELENKYDQQFKDVYDAISFLLQKDNQETDQKQRKRIGFKNDETT
jgi:ABC-type transport system involved in cytochrome bd biosynthesis fused ATPase/permease subunit